MGMPVDLCFRNDIARNLYVTMVANLMEHERKEFSDEGTISLPPANTLARAAFEIADAFMAEMGRRMPQDNVEDVGGARG